MIKQTALDLEPRPPPDTLQGRIQAVVESRPEIIEALVTVLLSLPPPINISHKVLTTKVNSALQSKHKESVVMEALEFLKDLEIVESDMRLIWVKAGFPIRQKGVIHVIKTKKEIDKLFDE